MKGKVKNVNRDKGYGFIKAEDGREFFFHRSALKNCGMPDMVDGREVEFTEEEGEKGPRAEDIYV